jgi:hypothetical protein
MVSAVAVLQRGRQKQLSPNHCALFAAASKLRSDPLPTADEQSLITEACQNLADVCFAYQPKVRYCSGQLLAEQPGACGQDMPFLSNLGAVQLESGIQP